MPGLQARLRLSLPLGLPGIFSLRLPPPARQRASWPVLAPVHSPPLGTWLASRPLFSKSLILRVFTLAQARPGGTL